MKSNIPDFTENKRRANQEARTFFAGISLAGCILAGLAALSFQAWMPKLLAMSEFLTPAPTAEVSPTPTDLPANLRWAGTATALRRPPSQRLPASPTVLLELAAQAETVTLSPPATPGATTTLVPALIQRSRLSGNWWGTETFTDMGSCQLGKGVSLSSSTGLRLAVNDEGEATGKLLSSWSDTFKGEIQPDLSVSLIVSVHIPSAGGSTVTTSNYEGRIQIRGQIATLDIQGREIWGSCTYLRRYSVEKTLGKP